MKCGFYVKPKIIEGHLVVKHYLILMNLHTKGQLCFEQKIVNSREFQMSSRSLRFSHDMYSGRILPTKL